MKQEEESRVKDLVEKLQRGEITPKEAKEKMKERGLREQESLGWCVYHAAIWVLYLLLWLPLNFKFSSQLPSITFPSIIIFFSLVLVAFATFSGIWMGHLHRKKGGLKGTDETVIFYIDGPYKIMRHPGGFCLMAWLIFVPIILSAYVPFTPLSIAAIIMMIAHFYHMVYVEEKINVRKWGDEYRQYMKEVPRFNFIKGLWNLMKRGN